MKRNEREKNNSFGAADRVTMSANQIVVGIDLGESESLATVMTPSGDMSETFPFPMDEKGYELFENKIPRDSRLAFEATGMAYPVFRALKSLGYNDITVAHPKELAWIVKSKKKNDRVDSTKIAKLHLVNMLPKSRLLERDEQIARDLLIQRVKIGVEISKLKNSVISYLKREAVYQSLPKMSDNFSVARRLAISSIKFNDDRDLVLKTMMERLEFLERQSSPIEDRIRNIASESDDVRLLMTIPGVDFYLASLLSSYICDVNRFPSFDHLSSYFGIIPVSKDSSEVKRRGRMSKDGPALGRWALSIIVDTVMNRNASIKDYYLFQKKRTGNTNYAHILTMKKLARMIYHMLKTREHWKWENEILTQSKISKLEATGGGRCNIN